MYYGSYKAPREITVDHRRRHLPDLMMATAFMGYVLPWGQMSFWGATVITNLFSAVPFVGEPIVSWLWGGFSVDNPTLHRFFSLHYLLPFVILGVVVLHVWALHVTGQTNPTGVEVKSKTDTVPFTPYATVKDAFAMSVFLRVRLLRLLHAELSRPPGQLHRGQSAGDAGAHRAGMVLPAVLRDPARHHLQHRPDRLQARRRACHVRLDRGAVRAALARHLEGALGGAAALLRHRRKPAAERRATERNRRYEKASCKHRSAPLGVGHWRGAAFAAGYPINKPRELDWSFAGPFGTYDKAQLQRGLKVYVEGCSACHSMNLVAFRTLEDLGYSEEQVKALAANYEVEDGPNADGEMFTRTAVLTDHFPSPFPNAGSGSGVQQRRGCRRTSR
jgi:hypothetical protein